MATIKDVALASGVSIATVSNYINHTKPVSKEVSKKIQQAIDTLKYSQNLSAKNLKSKVSVDIGVILPNYDNPYYLNILKGIEGTFVSTEYYLNIAISYDIPHVENAIIQSMLKKKVAGLILISCQPDNWKFYYDHFTSRNCPIVLIDRDISNLEANFVTFDNQSIIRQMTTYLLDNNYREIYLFSGPDKYFCENVCQREFEEVFNEKSVSLSQKQFVKTNFSKEDAFSKTIELLSKQTPDAIISTSEVISTGVMEALTLLGYDKDEIPLLTLGEAHWNLFTHSLSSVSALRPAIKLGEISAKLLIQQLISPHSKETERIILKDEKIEVYPKLTSIPPMLSHKKTSNFQKRIRILMLDTPQVHKFIGLLKVFEQQENIKIDTAIIPHHLFYDKILENYHMENDEHFDIIMYDSLWLTPLASNRVLADISEELETIDLSIFLPDCMKYFSKLNNRYYGIPFMYAPQVFYYRKDLFENPSLRASYEQQNHLSLRPPLTLKEFNSIADFFTNHTDVINYGISVPASYDEFLSPEIYMRMRAFGGSIFDKNGRACFNSAATLKAYINFIKSIHLAKPDYRTATDISAVQDFLNGETAMLITYPSFLTDVADLQKNNMIGSIGYHHIPGRSPLLGGWSFGISSKSSQKEDAFKFFKWFCENQIANYFTLLGGQTAISTTYTNDELNKLYPWLTLYYDTYQYSKPIISPSMNKYTKISQTEVDRIVCAPIYNLLDDKIDIMTAIEKSHFELEEYIKNI